MTRPPTRLPHPWNGCVPAFAHQCPRGPNLRPHRHAARRATGSLTSRLRVAARRGALALSVVRHLLRHDGMLGVLLGAESSRSRRGLADSSSQSSIRLRSLALDLVPAARKSFSVSSTAHASTYRSSWSRSSSLARDHQLVVAQLQLVALAVSTPSPIAGTSGCRTGAGVPDRRAAGALSDTSGIAAIPS